MKKNLIKLSLALVALLILLVTTDPQKLPSFLLITPFVIIFVFIFFGTKWFMLRHSSTNRKASRIAALCASLPTLLFVLLSLGQLTIKDVATTGILFVLSYFYISRNAFEQQ